MSEKLKLELQLSVLEVEFERLLEQLIKCYKDQQVARGELRRVCRLEQSDNYKLGVKVITGLSKNTGEER